MLGVRTNVHRMKKWLRNLFAKEVLVIFAAYLNISIKNRSMVPQFAQLVRSKSPYDKGLPVEKSLRNTSLYRYVIGKCHGKTLINFHGGLAQSRVTRATLPLGHVKATWICLNLSSFLSKHSLRGMRVSGETKLPVFELSTSTWTHR